MGTTLGAKKNCIPCGIELGAHSGMDGPRWPCGWKRGQKHPDHRGLGPS